MKSHADKAGSSAQEATFNSEGPSATPRALGATSILLVDDSASSLLALKEVLAPLGQKIVTAHTGEEALRLLLVHEFAVVLMDVKLPGIDGFETATLMRGAQRTRMIPIIFLTGVHREASEVLRGYDKGAVDYLLKPFDPDILRSKVAVFVELQLMREQVQLLMREDALRMVAEADQARLVERENERRLFQAVLTQMPAGVVIVKAPSGETLLSNDRLVNILGKQAAETVVGANGHPPLHLDQTPYTTSELPVARTLLTGETVDGESALYRRVGTPQRPEKERVLWLSMSSAPVYDESGQVIAVVGTTVDVTERHEADQERERLIRALEKSNAELQQFAYVASHDLKAPLRGIANLSNWIEDDLGPSVSEETRKHLSLLRGRVGRMEALIDGILKFARAGMVREEEEEVPLSELLSEVSDLLNSDANASILFAPDLPTVRAERVLLQQVLLNLIGNALKHAHRTDVKIEVDARTQPPWLHLNIKDNGPGIAPQYHERIWGIFQTLEPRDTVEGTGIGLAVVRKIVEARGGRTWVESTEGKGANFHVLWPS